MSKGAPRNSSSANAHTNYQIKQDSIEGSFDIGLFVQCLSTVMRGHSFTVHSTVVIRITIRSSTAETLVVSVTRSLSRFHILWCYYIVATSIESETVHEYIAMRSSPPLLDAHSN